MLELIIVMVIMGVVITFAVPAFRTTQERALDNEARANLRLIVAAEKIYRMETSNYYASAASDDEASINGNLKLLLATDASRKWGYNTVADNAIVPQTCCAQAARRNGPDARTWRMRNTEADLVSGACP